MSEEPDISGEESRVAVQNLLEASSACIREQQIAAARGICQQILERPDLAPEQRPIALLHRGQCAELTGEARAALADYTQALEAPEIWPKTMAWGLYHSALCHETLHARKAAHAAYTRAIALRGQVSSVWLAMCLSRRATLHEQDADPVAADRDLRQILDLPDIEPAWHARALSRRADLLTGLKQPGQALPLLDQAIALPDLPPDRRVGILLRRARIRFNLHHIKEAHRDYKTALSIPEITSLDAAIAHYFLGKNRMFGMLLRQRKNREKENDTPRRLEAAEADFTQALALADSLPPTQDVCILTMSALQQRGAIRMALHRPDEARADFVRSLKVPARLTLLQRAKKWSSFIVGYPAGKILLALGLI